MMGINGYKVSLIIQWFNDKTNEEEGHNYACVYVSYNLAHSLMERVKHHRLNLAVFS